MSNNHETQLPEEMQMLADAQLHTLLAPQGLHVFISTDFKIVFSKGQNIAIILGEKMFVRPDFFTGGKFHNVIINQEIELVKNTFQVQEVTTWKALQELTNVKNKYTSLIQTLMYEKDEKVREALLAQINSVIEQIPSADIIAKLKEEAKEMFDKGPQKPLTVSPGKNIPPIAPLTTLGELDTNNKGVDFLGGKKDLNPDAFGEIEKALEEDRKKIEAEKAAADEKEKKKAAAKKAAAKKASAKKAAKKKK